MFSLQFVGKIGLYHEIAVKLKKYVLHTHTHTKQQQRNKRKEYPYKLQPKT